MHAVICVWPFPKGNEHDERAVPMTPRRANVGVLYILRVHFGTSFEKVRKYGFKLSDWLKFVAFS